MYHKQENFLHILHLYVHSLRKTILVPISTMWSRFQYHCLWTIKKRFSSIVENRCTVFFEFFLWCYCFCFYFWCYKSDAPWMDVKECWLHVNKFFLKENELFIRLKWTTKKLCYHLTVKLRHICRAYFRYIWRAVFVIDFLWFAIFLLLIGMLNITTRGVCFIFLLDKFIEHCVCITIASIFCLNWLLAMVVSCLLLKVR